MSKTVNHVTIFLSTSLNSSSESRAMDLINWFARVSLKLDLRFNNVLFS